MQTAKGTVFGQSQDSFILLPIRTFALAFGGIQNNRAAESDGTPASNATMDQAVDEVRVLLRIKRKLATDEKDNFGISTPEAISSVRKSIFGSISIAIMAVPAIALLVGAIVIMNIMLVAVTERTKEIGIRKAVGARASDILRQVLIESATLSLIGGLIGLILGVRRRGDNHKTRIPDPHTVVVGGNIARSFGWRGPYCGTVSGVESRPSPPDRSDEV